MQHLSLYCERLGPGLLAEPLNAVTNFAFLIAAIMLARRVRALNFRDAGVCWLIVLLAAIGLGSLSFHTFANALTSFLDVVFIGVFILVFLYQSARRELGFSRLKSAVVLMLFMACVGTLSAALAPFGLKILAIYGSSFIVLMLLAVALKKRGNGAWAQYVLAGAVFSLSLTLRMLDHKLCNLIPFGTHFCWHLLNAVVLYILVSSFLPKKVA